MATTRAILQVFENWQKAKTVFVEQCTDLVTPRPACPSFVKALNPLFPQSKVKQSYILRRRIVGLFFKYKLMD